MPTRKIQDRLQKYHSVENHDEALE